MSVGVMIYHAAIIRAIVCLPQLATPDLYFRARRLSGTRHLGLEALCRFTGCATNALYDRRRVSSNRLR